MDLPITTLTWQQLAIGLWLIPLVLNLIVYAPRLAAELYADVVRARQGSYTTTSYADVVLALVISSIPLINVIALIFDAFPYALKRFGRFVGFVGEVLSKPIVPVTKKAAPAAEYEDTASFDEKTFHSIASKSRSPKIHMVSVPPRGNTKLGDTIDFGVCRVQPVLRAPIHEGESDWIVQDVLLRYVQDATDANACRYKLREFAGRPYEELKAFDAKQWWAEFVPQSWRARPQVYEFDADSKAKE